MSILITGAAGYIGSHVLKQLLNQHSGEKIVVLDNFYSGSKMAIDALNSVGTFELINMDLSDFEGVERLFSQNNFDSVLHFAAFIEVNESVKNPAKYYMNNTVNSANLFKTASQNGVKKLIFSSTAAVYGEPQSGVVSENSPTNPINPYGQSKLMSEKILIDIANASGMKYGILRYFNVAGASADGLIGQNYPNATHLIKVAAQCATKKRDGMAIFGDDYPTADGSCIRDYIHVEDLAAAHLAVLDYLDDNKSEIFNVGYGKGFSVKEVIKAAFEVGGWEFSVKNAIRREGDPAILIADNNKIKNLTSWRPKLDDLHKIIASAIAWERK